MLFVSIYFIATGTLRYIPLYIRADDPVAIGSGLLVRIWEGSISLPEACRISKAFSTVYCSLKSYGDVEPPRDPMESIQSG